jgi:hypothetical protein
MPRTTGVSRPTDELASKAWPVIDGIDYTEARARLCDDFGLFRSSLKRLIEEFADVAIAGGAHGSEALAAYAARMHKLTGSAGMLGADAIRQLAVDTRAACVDGDIERARRLADVLTVHMRRMSLSAAPVLRQARIEAEQASRGSPSCEVTVQPRQLIDLIQLLREQSLLALQRFDAIAQPLRRHLGDELFEITRDHIDNLRFMEAAKAIAAR